MHWLQIECLTRAPEALEEAFWAAGAQAITLQDAADRPVLEPLPGTTPLWPESRLTALFAQDSSLDQIREQLALAIDGPPPELRSELLEDREWVREWLRYFKPMRFGQRLWICPTDAAAPTEGVVLRLDPGLAFGTGTHPTTALCLIWLDGANLRDKTVLDYGCGSGILAIAALLLGATRADGIDIDTQALQATTDNAARNQVSVAVSLPDVTAQPATPYDVVLANILSGPLVQLAPQLCAALKTGGALVLSGLLAEQAEEVRGAYACWIDWAPTAEKEGWACLSGTRNTQPL